MKTFNILATAAAIALPMQFAAAGDATVNTQLVTPIMAGYSGGMGIAHGYEVPIPYVSPNFSVEGEFTSTISSPNSSFWGGVLSVSYFTFAGYAKYNLEINEKLDLFGRAGLVYINSDVACSDCVVADGDSTSSGVSFGVGINYEINPQVDFTAGYTVIASDTHHPSAGIKFKLK